MPKDHHQTFLGHLHIVLHIPIGTGRLCPESYAPLPTTSTADMRGSQQYELLQPRSRGGRCWTDKRALHPAMRLRFCHQNKIRFMATGQTLAACYVVSHTHRLVSILQLVGGVITLQLWTSLYHKHTWTGCDTLTAWHLNMCLTATLCLLVSVSLVNHQLVSHHSQRGEKTWPGGAYSTSTSF